MHTNGSLVTSVASLESDCPLPPLAEVQYNIVPCGAHENYTKVYVLSSGSIVEAIADENVV